MKFFYFSSDNLLMNKFKLNKKLLLSVSLFFSLIFLFADSSYKVQKGDTLYSISKKFQITVQELRAANNLSENDVIKAGQNLVIPTADISNAVSLNSSNKNQKADSNIKTSTHIVQKGETLYRIAKNNNMSVSELLLLNNLDSSSVIKVGQKLKVRDDSVSANVNVTKKDDSTNNSEKSVTSEYLAPAPDTRTYGNTIQADKSTVWPLKNPKVTYVKGKVSGVQLVGNKNETVNCIMAGTVMYVGVYRGFGQVLFVQSQTGLIYAYTGLGTIDVKKGDYVVSGNKLGTAGVDPITNKNQITFMVFQNGQPIDPAKAPRN